MSRQFGALSGLAMVLIVLNHAIQLSLNSPLVAGFPGTVGWEAVVLGFLQALGSFAVPIFLFISGGFISYAARGEPPTLSAKFIFSSLRHILIPYLLWSFAFYVLIYFLIDTRYSLPGYLMNLLTGYPFHFIPLLVFYYLLAPLLIRLFMRFGWVPLLAILGYQVFLMNYIFPGILGINYPDWARYLALPVLKGTLADWAIYFPLGLYFGINSKSLTPLTIKFRWVTATLTTLFFLLAVLNALGKVHIPWARFLSPFFFALVIPAIQRSAIPYVRTLENIGKRSYGLYLTHLLVLNLSLLLIRLLLPEVYFWRILLSFVLFLSGLLLPLFVMDRLAISPLKRFYRYLFG